MAYACIPASAVDIAAAIYRRHREQHALTRWVKLCGLDADEAAFDRNQNRAQDVEAEARMLRKAQRRAGR